jgi:Tol biopolymer transport system component
MTADGHGAPVSLNARHGGDTSISWSPDGEWLVYGSGQDIHAVRPDGTGHRNVTQTVGLPEEYPTFRRNGRISFSANLSAGGTDAWEIGMDGTGRTNLTSTPTESERYAAWQ